jgi:hypothetical protein
MNGRSANESEESGGTGRIKYLAMPAPNTQWHTVKEPPVFVIVVANNKKVTQNYWPGPDTKPSNSIGVKV